MDNKKTVLIGLLGTTLDDRGYSSRRWERWRPTVSLCQQEDLLFDRVELLFQNKYQKLADQVIADIAVVSPQTQIGQHLIDMPEPWDFEQVYASLHDFSRAYRFEPEQEDYLIHITTGSHVAQICLYLLTEANYLPGRLIQSSPAARNESFQIIDLDLSKYDRIASRFQKEHQYGTDYLKSGIATRNRQFNALIEQLEQVAVHSASPLLLTGPTGAGKSLLAKRIYQLKKQRGLVAGRLVQVNCATLRGDNAMSTLFGHRKGAFTGAIRDRAGLLAEAHDGVLFLDEIGELGLDEQAMLLRAIEDKTFMPLGSDREVGSDFQLLSGSNRDLFVMVEAGKFREDLLARINLWTFALPSLKQRLEDLQPNIDFELERFSEQSGSLVSFNKAARQQYTEFALSPGALWQANFRDLNASITRMATLAPGGRITESIVSAEIIRLSSNWNAAKGGNEIDLSTWLDEPLDYFEQVQLQAVIDVCRNAATAAEAGRLLFNVSRTRKSSCNDSHRLRTYLKKFGLNFEHIRKKISSE